MKLPFYYSLLLHLCIILLAFFGLPFFVKNDFNTEFATVIEVVPITDMTNVKVKNSDKKDLDTTQSKKAPQSVAKEEEKADSQSKESPKEQTIKKDEPAEKIPDKSIKDEKKKDEKKTDPVKNKKDEKKNKDKDDKKKKKPKDDSFEKAILKSLESEAKKKNDAKLDKDSKDSSDALKGDTNKEFNNSAPMSVSEIDAIKSQIVKNWNTSSFSGASEGAGMQVVVIIELDINGNVMSVIPKNQAVSSPYYPIFVESAIRAVKVSSPLQYLPQEKFHRWREIEFKFDSTGMIY